VIYLKKKRGLIYSIYLFNGNSSDEIMKMVSLFRREMQGRFGDCGCKVAAELILELGENYGSMARLWTTD
jgi:hypothetical protein